MIEEFPDSLFRGRLGGFTKNPRHITFLRMSFLVLRSLLNPFILNKFPLISVEFIGHYIISIETMAPPMLYSKSMSASLQARVRHILMREFYRRGRLTWDMKMALRRALKGR